MRGRPWQEIYRDDECVGSLLLGGIEAAHLCTGLVPGVSWAEQPLPREGARVAGFMARVVRVLFDCRTGQTRDGKYPTGVANRRGGARQPSSAGGWYLPLRGSQRQAGLRHEGITSPIPSPGPLAGRSPGPRRPPQCQGTPAAPVASSGRRPSGGNLIN